MDRKLNFLLKPLVVPQTCEGNKVGGAYTPAASTVAAGFSRSATFSGYQKMNGFTPAELSHGFETFQVLCPAVPLPGLSHLNTLRQDSKTEHAAPKVLEHHGRPSKLDSRTAVVFIPSSSIYLFV